MAATALLFPGQGSLTDDAGDLALAVCPDLVATAAELVGADPFGRAGQGTEFAQPAIFLASIAGWSARHRERDDVCAMAGHSLGELSALTAAGALEVDDALRLVVLRGRLMAAAARAAGSDGGMVAVLGGTPADASALAGAYGLTVANDNAPGQVVLSGERELVDAFPAVAREHGLKALVLDVDGAFHSAAVASARRPFFEALRAVSWSAPSVPVVSGLTAAPFTDPARELADALVSPVRWRDTMAALFDLGARDFVDVGPGRVLDRLARRNLPVLEEHALAG